jgi:hypothetical protein
MVAKQLIQPGIIAAIVNMRSQIHAIPGVFADIRILGQKPVKKNNTQGNNYIKDDF